MCELFGFSGSRSRRLAGWLTPFRSRGGATGDNPDGWGVAAWRGDGGKEGTEGNGGDEVDIVKSPEPGWSSVAFADLAAGMQARLLIAHVRKARHPPVPGMLNTHPFAHNCCGRRWIFAHNGLVPEVVEWQANAPPCQPLGETDSEHAFCHLLTAIAERYDAGEPRDWVDRLAELSERIAAMGKFNFLLSDGRVLIAHGHDRLHWLDAGDAQGPAVAIATEPLPDGERPASGWRPFAPGELRVYRDGVLLSSVMAAPGTTAGADRLKASACAPIAMRGQ